MVIVRRRMMMVVVVMMIRKTIIVMLTMRIVMMALEIIITVIMIMVIIAVIVRVVMMLTYLISRCAWVTTTMTHARFRFSRWTASACTPGPMRRPGSRRPLRVAALSRLALGGSKQQQRLWRPG